MATDDTPIVVERTTTRMDHATWVKTLYFPDTGTVQLCSLGPVTHADLIDYLGTHENVVRAYLEQHPEVCPVPVELAASLGDLTRQLLTALPHRSGPATAAQLIAELAAERDAALAEVERMRRDLLPALEACSDALDRLMGDSDIDDDTSPEFLACQRANILLDTYRATAPATDAEPAPEPEPGQPIAAGNCPCCGAALTIEHGDDEGEIAIVGSSKPCSLCLGNRTGTLNNDPCIRCNGSGKAPEPHCEECDGYGFVGQPPELDHDCETCKGTGKAPEPKPEQGCAPDAGLREAVERVLDNYTGIVRQSVLGPAFGAGWLECRDSLTDDIRAALAADGKEAE